MQLRYLRFAVFGALLEPFQRWARGRRMRDFTRLMRVRPQMSILDVGGQPHLWHMTELPALRITILNLPGVVQPLNQSHHRLDYVEGDGCNVTAFGNNDFDCVFSNSVIEHVGGAEQRRRFAAEVRRLGRSYWVQTPAKGFPIEAHSGMPLWWYYPPAMRERLIARWRAKLPEWTEMVEGTTVLTRAELAALFPDATIVTERVCGLPKSYIAYCTAPSVGASGGPKAPREAAAAAVR